MCEWKECKLGEAPLEILDGDRGKNYPSQDEFKERGHCLFLSTKNVRFDGFDFSECQFISKERDNLLGKGKLQKNDIVLTTRGTVGNIGFFNNSVKFDHIRINSGMVIIRPDENKLLPTFNYYIFRKLQNDFHTFVSGSAQPQLPIRDLKEVEVLIPPLPEQRAIASVLSSLDDKIDLLHRQNQTLEAMAETLFRQWFVEEAEEGWESKISELPIKIIDGDRGKNYPKKDELFNTGDCLFLSAKNVTTNGFNFNQCQFITSEKDSLLRSGKLKRNDIIITTRGTVGNIAYYDDLINFSDIRINSGMIILRTEPSVLDPIFVFCLISSNYFMCLIESQTSGSAQPQIPIRDFKQIEVLFPPKEKIDDFLTFAKPCLNKKFNNDSQIRTLEKLRDTLLPKLMSGEVRVQLVQGEAAI